MKFIESWNMVSEKKHVETMNIQWIMDVSGNDGEYDGMGYRKFTEMAERDRLQLTPKYFFWV